MEAVKRQVRAWYLSCGAVCLAFLSIPFLWRTHASLVVCFLPCVGLGLLIGLVVWLCKTQIGYKPIVIGVCLMSVCFFLGSSGDEFARSLIFRWNYRSYHDFAKRVVSGKLPEIGRHEYLPGHIRGFGVYRGEIEVFKNRYVVRIDTCAGPTLETVEFSPTSIRDAKHTFKHRDDLGYWYFVDW